MTPARDFAAARSPRQNRVGAPAAVAEGASGASPARPEDCALWTEGLCKRYGEKWAVRDLSLRVARGEVFGFLGPNGAGKSTSVKMLLGLVRPSGGAAWVLGYPPGDSAIRARIGFLPEHFRFYDWLTPRELLRLHARLLGGAAELGRQADELLRWVGLADHADRRLREYSKGMLQRAGLAQALLNRPDLIVLDEPTSGLDPAGRRLVREILRRERERGATIFLNSHLLGEVEATCDRVAFLRDGEVRAVRNVGAAARGLRVVARVAGLSPAGLAALTAWAAEISHVDGELSFVARDEEALPAILASLIAGGARVYSFAPRPVTLEDLFLEIVGDAVGQ
ncbi:MAG TPA: ABC transporter ATP-binding protein [Terriglobales bacterium]|nr:ABC transporter ATP-binding protein [Terriglobales bacterium]